MSSSPPLVVADRYRLVAPLGQGGMGRVWRATDVVLHREVAIKELVPPPGLTPGERQEMRERSLREARAIARLNNVNVVRVFDVLRTDADPWIVMEYVPSRSLQDTLAADGPFNPMRAAEIGLGVLGALRAAHRAGVVHRDVKPGNVLIGADGRVVLTDFGLATVPGDPNVTRTGLVLGSPAYIAPERARDGTAGPAADLWSLGATLYAAVEGASPFARPSAIATLAALATENPPPARNAGSLKPVLNGLLRKDPAHRINAEEAERLLMRATGRRSKLAFPMSPTMRRPGVGRERPALPGVTSPTSSSPVVPGPRPPVAPARPANPPGPAPAPGARPAVGQSRPPVYVPGKAPVGNDKPTRVDTPPVREDQNPFSRTRRGSATPAPAQPATPDKGRTEPAESSGLTRTRRGEPGSFTAADVAAARRKKAAPEHEQSLADATTVLPLKRKPAPADATSVLPPTKSRPPAQQSRQAPADATSVLPPTRQRPPAQQPPAPADATSVLPSSRAKPKAPESKPAPADATSVLPPTKAKPAESRPAESTATGSKSTGSTAGEPTSAGSTAAETKSAGSNASTGSKADESARAGSTNAESKAAARAGESTSAGSRAEGSAAAGSTLAESGQAGLRAGESTSAASTAAESEPVASKAAPSTSADSKQDGSTRTESDAAESESRAADAATLQSAEAKSATTAKSTPPATKSPESPTSPAESEADEPRTEADAPEAAKPTTNNQADPAEATTDPGALPTGAAEGVHEDQATTKPAPADATSVLPPSAETRPTGRKPGGKAKTSGARAGSQAKTGGARAGSQARAEADDETEDQASKLAFPLSRPAATLAAKSLTGAPAPVDTAHEDSASVRTGTTRPAWRPMEVGSSPGVTVFGTRLTYRQAAVGASVVLVVLVLLITLIAQAVGGDGNKTAAPLPGPSATGQANTKPGQSTDPSPPSGQPSTPPSTAPAATLPAGWSRRTIPRDGSAPGLVLALPTDATRSKGDSEGELQFRWNNRLLIMGRSSDPKPDALKDSQQQEASRRGDYNNYRPLGIRPVKYRGFKSVADWEFLYTTSSGNDQHVLARNILVSNKAAYTLKWYVSPEDWQPSQPDLQAIFAGFQPK